MRVGAEKGVIGPPVAVHSGGVDMGSGKKTSSGFHTPFSGLKSVVNRAPAPTEKNAGKPAEKPAQNIAGKPAPKTAPTPQAKPAPPASPSADADDARTFEQAMRGVTPLSSAERRRRASPLDAAGPKAPPTAAARAARARREDADAEAELADLVSGDGAASGAAAGVAAGVDRRLVRRLRSGDYPIDASLDLHGKSRDEAERALDAFVAASQAAGRRCVLVIHGRGLNSGDAGPVLGDAVHNHLGGGRAARAVLAYTLAPPQAGGDGATLVLLRKKNKER